MECPLSGMERAVKGRERTVEVTAPQRDDKPRAASTTELYLLDFNGGEKALFLEFIFEVGRFHGLESHPRSPRLVQGCAGYD
jgi:hypothetical protein